MSRDAEALEVILTRRHAAVREAEELRELRELRAKLQRAVSDGKRLNPKWKEQAT